jgi:hypothetical protein
LVNRLAGTFRRPTQGSPGRTRTYDPAVNSRLLYQLSYRGMKFFTLIHRPKSDKGGRIRMELSP